MKQDNGFNEPHLQSRITISVPAIHDSYEAYLVNYGDFSCYLTRFLNVLLLVKTLFIFFRIAGFFWLKFKKMHIHTQAETRYGKFQLEA